MPSRPFSLPELSKAPKRWLVTGAAGFIGSHLVEALLNENQIVTGLDDFSTGKRENLEDVRSCVAPTQWKNFSLIEGDIRQFSCCMAGCSGVDVVLHQAALGSVTRSVVDPVSTHEVNVQGFFNMLVAAKENKVARFVYASSSSVYGDNTDLPKRELTVGKALSPYALSKKVNELYAQVFADIYGVRAIGLRYFNVFGPRQNPFGEYAAVIPRWIIGCLSGSESQIFGDGSNSRDFCYIDNVIYANFLAALCAPEKIVANPILNIGGGQSTDLKTLFEIIQTNVRANNPKCTGLKPKYSAARPGDVLRSLADISLAKQALGYSVQTDLIEGIKRTVDWFASKK